MRQYAQQVIYYDRFFKLAAMLLKRMILTAALWSGNSQDLRSISFEVRIQTAEA
jgi:hypothetical protein